MRSSHLDVKRMNQFIMSLILGFSILIGVATYYMSEGLYRDNIRGFDNISWTPFIKVGDTMYYKENTQTLEATNHDLDSSIKKSDLGEYIGRVKFTVSKVRNNNYEIQHLDTSCVPKGTKLYYLKGDSEKNSIVALVKGKYLKFSVYELVYKNNN